MNANRHNDRAFAATLAATLGIIATALCLQLLAGAVGHPAPGTNPAPAAAVQAPRQAAVTVLEPVVITSQRTQRAARVARDDHSADRSAAPRI